MEDASEHEGSCCCCRREFLQIMGATAGSVVVLRRGLSAAAAAARSGGQKEPAKVLGAFVYTPSEVLRRQGYWSWPGSSFDPEGRQQEYEQKIDRIAGRVGVRTTFEKEPVNSRAEVDRFLGRVRQEKPDGLLLVCFKKHQWDRVRRVVEESDVPAVVAVPTGVLLAPHVRELHLKTGAYLINSEDIFGPLEDALNMIGTARWMAQARIVNLAGEQRQESEVVNLGTTVLQVPLSRFLEGYRGMEATAEVGKLARSYRSRAREVVEPSERDVLDAAKTYFVLKEIIREASGDAVMMNCLPGLQKPHQHPPPCMGFMSLRDEGIPAGCQSDLSSTLTLMLVQRLFGKPGFQQNASMDTERNHYWGAHCTSASRMQGTDKPPEPTILRSHSEAGWGCVPQVLFTPGQKVTMAQYLPGEKPRMYIYAGEVVRCHPKKPAGCRTNVEMTIDGVDDVCDVKGMHQIIFYGDHARRLRTFCRLYGIEAIA